MKKIKMKKRFGLIGTLMVAVAMVALTGVAHADGHLKFPIGEGEFSWDSYHAFAKANDFSGQQLTIIGPWSAADEDKIVAMFAYFAEATSADVRYTGSQNFSQEVMVDAEAGSSANLTASALPGLLATIAKRGFLTKLDPDIAGWIRDNYAAGQSFVDLGTYVGPDGKKAFYGASYQSSLKSNVFYVPENFEDAGYEIPQTWEELNALEDRIVANGETPWCVGLQAEGSTGWPSQDTLEEVVLRSYPVEVYDKWITNEIKFDDPRIVAALEELGKILRSETKVAGGPTEVNGLDWRVASAGIFDNPPKCYMYHQGSYMTEIFPEDKKFGDWGFFYYPPKASKPELGRPVNGGGGYVVISKDSPAARVFIEWIKTPIAHELWMAQGDILSPHKHANQAVFPEAFLNQLNEILLSADPFRYDASDLMPGAIGGVAFNRGMIDYVGGKSAKDVL